MVDFVEKYTLAQQKEIQYQYYNSTLFTIFVHIVYKHVDDNVEENINILREYNFYVSDN